MEWNGVISRPLEQLSCNREMDSVRLKQLGLKDYPLLNALGGNHCHLST